MSFRSGHSSILAERKLANRSGQQFIYHSEGQFYLLQLAPVNCTAIHTHTHTHTSTQGECTFCSTAFQQRGEEDCTQLNLQFQWVRFCVRFPTPFVLFLTISLCLTLLQQAVTKDKMISAMNGESSQHGVFFSPSLSDLCDVHGTDVSEAFAGPFFLLYCKALLNHAFVGSCFCYTHTHTYRRLTFAGSVLFLSVAVHHQRLQVVAAFHLSLFA